MGVMQFANECSSHSWRLLFPDNALKKYICIYKRWKAESSSVYTYVRLNSSRFKNKNVAADGSVTSIGSYFVASVAPHTIQSLSVSSVTLHSIYRSPVILFIAIYIYNIIYIDL